MTKEETWLLKEKYKGERTEGFFADVARLNAGEPLAYIIGNTPFLNCTVYLDGKPLIPRVETEYWVEKIIPLIKKEATVLDLCAGSGCIGVSILKAIPESSVDFAELDERLHGTIRKNLQANDVAENRSKIFGGDLLENVHDTYDAILSNPPYINKASGTISQSVAAYEPHLALFGGVKGVEIIERIIAESPNHLKKDGFLVLEHEPEQIQTIHSLAEKASFADIQTHTDQFNTPRYTILRMAQ